MAYYAITAVECGDHYSHVVQAKTSVQAIGLFNEWLADKLDGDEIHPWVVSIFSSETEIL